jgi:hypothetical protein
MKKSLDEMAVEMQDEGLESRSEEFGDMVISHVRLPANFDPSPMFEALPGGVCSIPHWGRVLEGELHLRYADGTEEVTRAGDFFSFPPGHAVWTEDVGVVWMDVAPVAESRRVNELLGM